MLIIESNDFLNYIYLNSVNHLQIDQDNLLRKSEHFYLWAVSVYAALSQLSKKPLNVDNYSLWVTGSSFYFSYGEKLHRVRKIKSVFVLQRLTYHTSHNGDKVLGVRFFYKIDWLRFESTDSSWENNHCCVKSYLR